MSVLKGIGVAACEALVEAGEWLQGVGKGVEQLGALGLWRLLPPASTPERSNAQLDREMA